MSLTKTQQRQLDSLSHQKILILGAGREGLSTYRFLRRHLPQQLLTIADHNYRHQLQTAWQDAFRCDNQLRFLCGPTQYLKHLSDFDLIFRTPGIPLTLPEIIHARQLGTTFTSNTQLFFQLARGTTIGVTGTKGKSTTSSLIAHLLKTAGLKTQLVGNIGLPPLDYLEELGSRTYTVLELSAHQLQDLHSSPHYAVVQNITSEHLDYYKNTATYIEAKTNIVRWQKKSDFIIYSDDFSTSKTFAQLTPAHQLIFGLKDAPSHLAFAKNHAIFYRSSHLPFPESVVDLKKVKLLGQHNLYNLMPAVIIAKQLGISNQQLATALYSFTPLRHRLEYVATINDVSYYNDSLSTTPVAAAAALKTFSSQPIILLAGGHERHQDFTYFAKQILKQPVKAVLLFAPTGKRLKRTLIDLAIQKKALVPQFYDVEDMTTAIALAARLSQPQDLVLLSPAAASFGIFKDYADRGDQFCHAVKNLL